MIKRVLFEKNGHKLIGKVATEGSKQRVAVLVYQKSKYGEISIPTVIQRSDLIKKSKTLQDLLNLSICLNEDELNEVIEKAIAMLESPDKVAEAENIGTQATPSQLYRAICEHGKYVTSNPIIPQTEDEPKQMIWIDSNYLNIRTSDFNDFLKEVQEADEYKRSDILRSLKLLGVLDTDKGRAFDKKISKDSKKFNIYRIQLPVEKNKKAKVGEVIPVETVEENPAVETKSEPALEPAEANEGVQMTVEEILNESEPSTVKLEPTESKAEPTREREKLINGIKEMLAKDADVKLEPTVIQNEETLTEEDYGGCYFG